MAIRSMAIPLLSGGAVLFGYAAFSWFRAARVLRAPSGPTLPRERVAVRPAAELPLSEPVPLHQPLNQHEEIMDLDPSFVQELPLEAAASFDLPELKEVGVAPEDLRARFLARAADALSPFGDHSGHRRFELGLLGTELGTMSEASARAANGDTLSSHDEIPESERRPKAQRIGARR